MVGGKYIPWEWPHTDRGTNHVRAKDSGTNHVRVELAWNAAGWFVEGYAEYFFQTPMPKPPGGPQTPTHPPPSALNCWLWSVVSAESICFFGVLQGLKYVLPALNSNRLWEYGLSRNSL